MDVDVQWSREVAAGGPPATIRFWQWASPAVVVGRFQSIPDEVHEDVAAKEGFTVVRRCTGGGAMFIEPGNTITYSLYAPRWFAADLDIEESYRLCDMWLIAALLRFAFYLHYSTTSPPAMARSAARPSAGSRPSAPAPVRYSTT